MHAVLCITYSMYALFYIQFTLVIRKCLNPVKLFAPVIAEPEKIYLLTLHASYTKVLF